MDAERAPAYLHWQREAERIGRLIREQHEEFLYALEDYTHAVARGDSNTCYAAINAGCASLRRMLLVMDAQRETFPALRSSIRDAVGNPIDAAGAQPRPWPSVPGRLDDLIAETQQLISRMCSLGAGELREAATNLRILSNYAEARAERTRAE